MQKDPPRWSLEYPPNLHHDVERRPSQRDLDENEILADMWREEQTLARKKRTAKHDWLLYPFLALVALAIWLIHRCWVLEKELNRIANAEAQAGCRGCKI